MSDFTHLRAANPQNHISHISHPHISGEKRCACASGFNSTVTNHTDYLGFLKKSERVVWRCDNTS